MAARSVALDCQIVGQGQPIVFLHGALADARMWASHCEIAAQHFSAVTYTQRYFRQPQTVDPSLPFGIETHAHDLIGFIEALKLPPLHLVAWSYGADVALHVAVDRPDLLKSLFIYEPGFPSYVEDADALAAFAADAEAMFQPVFEAVSAGDLAAGVRALINGSGQSADYFDRQPEAFKEQQLQNAHTLPLQLSQSPPPEILAHHLSGIEIPVCAAHGENTRPLFHVVTETAQQHLSGFSYPLIIPEVGHMLPLEDPQEFMFYVAHFIDEVG